MPRTLFDELKIKKLEVLVTKKITILDRDNIQIEAIIIALDEIIKENQLTDIQKSEINCLKNVLESLKDMEDINLDDLKDLINVDWNKIINASIIYFV